MIPDYYAILGVNREGTPEAVRAAFREKAHRYHPDVNSNTKESNAFFRLILNAYSVLRDEDSRHRYDVYLDHGPARAEQAEVIEIADASHALSLVFEHLNYLLWEVEDLFRHGDGGTSDVDRDSRDDVVVEILKRIDEEVLTPAGFADYFYAARRLKVPDGAARFGDQSGHRQYASVEDYLYNVRQRVNAMGRRSMFIDLETTKTGDGRDLIDLILAVYNSGIDAIAGLHE